MIEHRSPRGRVRRLLTGLSLAALSASVLATPAGAADGSDAQVPDHDYVVPDAVVEETTTQKDARTYVVRMADDPIVAYDGDIAGYAATKPEEGEKVDADSPDAQRYGDRLEDQHDDALRGAGAGTWRKLYDYTTAVNGFAAKLTSRQAARLAQQPGVITVQGDELRQPTTDTSGDFLGLSDKKGLWSDRKGPGLTGEGVIVGIIDTGINPDHPSFADDGSYAAPPEHWAGECESDPSWTDWTGDECNDKLIGARTFNAGYLAMGASEGSPSPRDYDGHGSHVASTAAGNADVAANLFGTPIGAVSGMAPRAHVAAYKACFVVGCPSSDLVEAIDTAVADGVDVINYSIGGSAQTVLTADAISFLFAQDAGVFVATSNGNSGPGAGTVGNPAVAPWMTSVGASTHDRVFGRQVTTGDGASYDGVSSSPSAGPAAFVDSAALGNELCEPGAGFEADITGAIVLCQRGQFLFTDKIAEVRDNGGVGIIIYSNVPGAPPAITDDFPTVIVTDEVGAQLQGYIADAGDAATVALSEIVVGERDGAVMADFSSRGPNGASEDVIKPDVTAPGVDILAASEDGADGFMAISGTSMSSPHVAGIGALLKEAYPDRSPSAIKSMLMTSAYTKGVTKEDGTTPADPFDMGAGHIDPNEAYEVGLVYESGFWDNLGFMCSNDGVSIFANPCDQLEGFAGDASGPQAVAAFGDPSDYNLPSVAIGQLAGTQTVVRTITNVSDGEIEAEAKVKKPKHVQVKVRPDEVELAPGESVQVEIEFTVKKKATLDSWAFGSLEWDVEEDGEDEREYRITSPIAVKPVLFGAPDTAVGTGTDGSVSYEVGFGYAGDFSASLSGLVGPSGQDDTVVDDPEDDINAALASGVGITQHLVPAGDVTRIALFDEATDGADDLDLYVFSADDGSFIGSSGSGTSAERVDVAGAPASAYVVIVHGWETDGPDAEYTLFSWSPTGDAGNASLTAPASASLGTGTISVAWSGLADGLYIGGVTYTGAGGTDLGATIIDVSAP